MRREARAGRGDVGVISTTQFRQMARDAGSDPASLSSFNVFGAPRDLEVLKRYHDAGVDRVVLMLPPKPRDAILPMPDESAALVTAL